MGSLFTAAPAKRSRCSLPWTWGISSRLLLLTLDVGLILSAAAPDLGTGVTLLAALVLRSSRPCVRSRICPILSSVQIFQ